MRRRIESREAKLNEFTRMVVEGDGARHGDTNVTKDVIDEVIKMKQTSQPMEVQEAAVVWRFVRSFVYFFIFFIFFIFHFCLFVCFSVISIEFFPTHLTRENTILHHNPLQNNLSQQYYNPV